jgi:integrase
MINRNNKKLLDDYLYYRAHNDRLDPKSVSLERTLGCHYLYWCNELDFRNASKAPIHFVDYVENLVTRNGNPASSDYKRKLVGSARSFFEWLSIHKKGFRSVTPAWLSTFKYKSIPDEFDDEDTIIEEEMLILANLPVETLTEKRIRAGACFLYLSGMRISAFTSMRIKSFNIEGLEVYQSPKFGMRTKNKKTATTYVLAIDPIINHVREWDAIVRSTLSPDGFWFAPLSPTGEIDASINEVGIHRSSIFRNDLTGWLAKHNVLRHSPHDFRRGHASYLWERSRDYSDLSAIAKQLMHVNLTTTELYARKRKAQIKHLINEIANRAVGQEAGQDVIVKLNLILQKMDNYDRMLRSKNE